MRGRSRSSSISRPAWPRDTSSNPLSGDSDDDPPDGAAFVLAIAHVESRSPDACPEELHGEPGLEPSVLANAVDGERVELHSPVQPGIADRLAGENELSTLSKPCMDRGKRLPGADGMVETLVVQRGIVQIVAGNLLEGALHRADGQASPPRALSHQFHEIRIDVERGDLQARVGEDLAAQTPTGSHVEHAIPDSEIGMLQRAREPR